MRIKAELQERGLGNDLIVRFVEEQGFDWYQLMQQAAASKGGLPPSSKRKLQQKLARFLEYRGFPASMIRRYLWDDD